jgi:hypothetical protein
MSEKLPLILTAIFKERKIPQLTHDEAVALASAKWWEHYEPYQVALIQLSQRVLLTDMEVFGNMVELAMQAPVVRSAIPTLRKEFLTYLRNKYRK